MQRHAEELEQRVEQRTAQLSRRWRSGNRPRPPCEQSEHKYRELVENVNSIILRMDPKGRITFLNEFGQRFFGYPEEEICWAAA